MTAASSSQVEPARIPSFRMQTAMVLFALEESLGDFVISSTHDVTTLPASLRSEIERRTQGSGFVAVSQLIQETFLREILELAVIASRERSEHEAMKHLRELAENFDLFEIRNAVCHPNRSFPLFYWFRMAALASDPSIEQTRFRKVTEALSCALDNRLSEPPDGWLSQRTWTVPNSLPSTFDHQLTGLIARQTEAIEFRKLLRNLRNSLIAIVGPGGTGKTALCLEILRESCQDPNTLKWADQVTYVSAKTETLTVRGVEPIADPLTSLESVKSAVIQSLYGSDDGSTIPQHSFEEIAEQMADRKLLLCIDNLETLLRDHPGEFEGFVQELPRNWRVLVTSRVTVNGANVLTLGPIKREGAVKLARDYTSLRGAQRLGEDNLSRLVDVCDRNPLAIRLAVDSFAAGSSLDDALAQTKEQITDFSYTTLIDHLPQNAGRTLESLFGGNEPLSRGQIGDLLDLSPDEVAEAVNSILRTSLVTRVIDGSSERYALSSSVRDLLLRTPQDARLREDVYKRLRDQERIADQIDKSGTKDQFDESFVPQQCPAHIKVLISKVRPSVIGRSSRGDQTKALSEIQKALTFETQQGALHRTEALLLEQLGDPYRALEALKKAVSCPEQDNCAQLRLAELLREEQRLDSAVEQTQPLIDAQFLSRPEVSTRNKARLFRVHYVSLLWLKRYDFILNEVTSLWKQQTELRPSFVALRVSALQRYIDEKNIVGEDAESYIANILECLTEDFHLDGYLPDTVHEAFRALDRVCRLESRGQLTEYSLMNISTFLDAHLPSLCATSYEHDLSDDFIKEMVARFRKVGGKGNPLNGERWSDLVLFGVAEDKALANVGYLSARVTKTFGTQYVNAKAIEGSRMFFVHRRDTELGVQQFAALKEGQILLILPNEAAPERGKYWTTKHAMLDA